LSDFISTFFSMDNLLITTIVPFLFVLTIVVFVHEMGHYLVGRWCGIGVRAFSIGFGPELLGFNDRRGTRWKLSAIPLGGYVKFTGDMSVTSDPNQHDDELTPQERKEAFHLQPVWKRALTVFAGPFANFILTVVVFAVLFGIYGRFVSEPMVAEVRPDSPAAVAGFEPGDRFVSVNGSRIETFSDVQRIVSGRGGDELVFVMLRGGEEVTLRATPEMVEQTDAMGNNVRVAVIGVVNNEELGQPRQITYGPLEAL
jgi:regulator of sigma E protease